MRRVEDSLSRQSTLQNKKEILGVFINEVSKSLYDVFGLECGRSIVIDHLTNEAKEEVVIEKIEDGKIRYGNKFESMIPSSSLILLFITTPSHEENKG